MKDTILRMVAVLTALCCFSVAAFFSWQIYQQKLEYQEGDDLYALMEQVATETPPGGNSGVSSI